MLLLCYHSLGPRTPMPMQPRNVVRYEHGFVRKELYTIRYAFLPHAHPPVHSFTLFFCLMLPKDTFPTLRGLPTTWLLTCWGADCSVFSPFIASITSRFLCTNSRNRGYLRHHLIGTSTGCLPLFLHFSGKPKPLL